MRLRSRWTRLLFQTLGVALFAVILARVDLGEIGSAYRHIRPLPALAGVALLFALTLLKAQRWRAIVRAQGPAVGLGRAFRIYAASLYLGVVTPGHVGDFAKTLYLANRGLPVGRALMSSVADRLLDVVALAVFGFASLLLAPGIFENQLLVSSIVAVAAAIAVAGFFLRRDILTRLVRGMVAAFPRGRLREGIDRAVTEGLGDFAVVRGRVLAKVVGLTIAAWTAHYLFFVIFARALGLEAGTLFVVVCVSAAVFTSLVPVSISGLGTRDLVLILIFARAGLSREAAVTFSFSFILVYLVQGITGLVCWLTAPFDAERGGEPAEERGA